MSRSVTPEIEWINECYPVDEYHLHVSLYLLEHRGSMVLVDTGSFFHRDRIRAELEALGCFTDLDTLILSNAGFIHAGNISMFLDSGDVEVVCFIGGPEKHGYTDAISADPGQSLSVGENHFTFIEPIVTDLGSCGWTYHHQTGALFTSDGFGHYHRPGTCEATSDELEGGFEREAVYRFQAETLRWLKYVDPAEIEDAVDRVFDAYDVEYLLPVHGHPIVREDIDDYLEHFVESIYEIAGASDELPGAEHVDV